MEDKVGLTLACLNLKKLVKRMLGKPFYFTLKMEYPSHFLLFYSFCVQSTRKDKLHLRFVFSLSIMNDDAIVYGER